MVKKDESTAVAIPEEQVTALAGVEDIDWADDGVRPEEVRLSWPMIRLVQGTSRGIPNGDEHMGQFWHPDTGKFEKELLAIPLLLRTQRAFFEQDAQQPACASRDAIHPEENQLLWTKPQVTHKSIKGTIEVPEGIPFFCDDCPFSKWGPEGESPLCGESILLMLRREDGSFAQLRVGGTGIRPIRTALGKMLQNNKRLPAFAHKWRFTSEAKEQGTRKWRQLVVSTEPLARAEQIAMNDLVKEMRSAMTSSADATVAEEAVDVGYVD